VEIISNADSLAAFAPEWSHFVSSQGCVTPFQLPDWLLVWWSHFGSGSLRAFVFRDAGCIGVVPCFLHEWNGARQITLLGSGISDCLDPVLAPGREREILARLGTELAEASDWDLCDWQDLAFDSPLQSLSHAALHVQQRQEVMCTEASLPSSFDQYWRERPRHLHRNIRRYREKARESGSLDFSVATNPQSDALDALIRLHTSRWSTRGEPGMIQANHSAAFLLDIAPVFAAQDMLRVFTLRYQDDIAAVILAFAYRKVLYGYVSGFDPKYSRFSVAGILLHESLRHCCENGFKAWNFCRGDEPYKTDWGAEAIRRCRVVVRKMRS
jgi:CelD/BcsL family acetyltransferase involved in cellulose biosynthesis